MTQAKSIEDLLPRLERETDPAYSAVREYALMGRDRSLLKLAEKIIKNRGSTGEVLGNKQGKKPIPSMHRSLKIWSSKFNWQARIKVWDDHLLEVEYLKQIATIEARTQDYMDNSARLARQLEVDAENMLKAPLFTQTVIQEDGTTVKIVAPRFARRDAAIFLKMAKEFRDSSILTPGERLRTESRNDQLVKDITNDILAKLQGTLPSEIFATVVEALQPSD